MRTIFSCFIFESAKYNKFLCNCNNNLFYFIALFFIHLIYIFIKEIFMSRACFFLGQAWAQILHILLVSKKLIKKYYRHKIYFFLSVDIFVLWLICIF